MFGFDGRDGQIEAIQALLFNKRDTVLIAATSYGNSLIPQMVSMLDNKSITFMIVPLTAVALDQFNKMKILPNANPILLCEGKVSKTALEDIRKGMYTHILLSSELAVSDSFSDITVDPQFKSKVGLVVIDGFSSVLCGAQKVFIVILASKYK